MTPDLCRHISCSPVESIEPAEEALRGRSWGEGGGRRSTPAGGGSAQRRAVHLVGLSFISMGVVTKGVMWRYTNTLVTRCWRITIHGITYCLIIKSCTILSKLEAGQTMVVGGDDLLLWGDPCTQGGVAAGALVASAGLIPLWWVPSNAGRSGWEYVWAVEALWLFVGGFSFHFPRGERSQAELLLLFLCLSLQTSFLSNLTG